MGTNPLQSIKGGENVTFSVKKITGSHTRRNFEDNYLNFFSNSQNWMCLPVKLKKTAVQQPLPPKTAIFRRKLTFLMIMIQFFFYFLITVVCRRIFFISFLTELDNSELFYTNFFKKKKNQLVFALALIELKISCS